MILPLPVKKNKFGQRVDDISVNDYYRQIAEEIIEAHEESFSIAGDDEGLELVDVITTCITRLDIMHWFEDDEDFGTYLENLIAESQTKKISDDFYAELTSAAFWAYHCAEMLPIFNKINKEGCGMCIDDIDGHYDEESALADIIAMCIDYLEFIGYGEDDRQKLYQAVNEKNRKRGYFDD